MEQSAPGWRWGRIIAGYHRETERSLNLNRVCDLLYAKDNKLQVASLADLAGMEIAVIQKRAQWRDFVDVGAILESGLSLGCMVAATQAIYGKQFNPMIALKALSYHNDIDLSEALPEDVEQLNASLSPSWHL